MFESKAVKDRHILYHFLRTYYISLKVELRARFQLDSSGGGGLSKHYAGPDPDQNDLDP